MGKKYFTLKEYEKAESYEDLKDNTGVVLYSKEAVREIERKADCILVQDELPGGMIMVLEVIMQEEDGTFYHIPIDTERVVKEVLEIDLMLENGIRCMEEHFPALIENTEDVVGVTPLFRNPNFYLVHTDKIYGGSAFFYEGMMERLAEKCGGNYFVMPLTRDFFVVTPDDGTKDLDRLQEVFYEQIKKYDDIWFVSNDILYYDSSEKELMTAEDAANKSNIIYINETTGDYMN